MARDRTRSRVLPDQEAVLSEIPATHLHCPAASHVVSFIEPSFFRYFLKIFEYGIIYTLRTLYSKEGSELLIVCF